MTRLLLTLTVMAGILTQACGQDTVRINNTTKAVISPIPFRVGQSAVDPTAPGNGSLWYDTATNKLEARINGATVELGAASSITGADTQVTFFDGANTPAGDAELLYNKTSNTLTTGSFISTADAAVGNDLSVTGETNTSTFLLDGHPVVLAGAFTTAGAFALALTTTAQTNVTLPTSGTLVSATTLNNSTLPGAFTTLSATGPTTQFGATHATTPTNQTLRAHDVTTGTGAALNLAGGNGTSAVGAKIILNGGISTTTGGSIVLQTAAIGTLTDRLTIAAAGTATFNGGYVRGNGYFDATGAGGNGGFLFVTGWLKPGATDGISILANNGGTTFNRLDFVSSTSASPSLKRVGTELQVTHGGTAAAINVAAVDADLTFIEDRYRRKGTGTPEGVVTAPIGAIYHRTDGADDTAVYIKVSGTGSTLWKAIENVP